MSAGKPPSRSADAMLVIARHSSDPVMTIDRDGDDAVVVRLAPAQVDIPTRRSTTRRSAGSSTRRTSDARRPVRGLDNDLGPDRLRWQAARAFDLHPSELALVQARGSRLDLSLPLPGEYRQAPLVAAGVAAPSLPALLGGDDGDQETDDRVEPPRPHECVAEQSDQERRGEVSA
jgi:hypothetical protein